MAGFGLTLAAPLPGARRLHRRAAVPRQHQRVGRAVVLRCGPPRLGGPLQRSRGRDGDPPAAPRPRHPVVSIEAVRRRLGHASTETTQLTPPERAAGRQGCRRRDPRRAPPMGPVSELTGLVCCAGSTHSVYLVTAVLPTPRPSPAALINPAASSIDLRKRHRWRLVVATLRRAENVMTLSSVPDHPRRHAPPPTCAHGRGPRDHT
jgi:hypothetical protein